ncbi:unnamed protein product, partial [Rotaria sp. Silwood1]
MDACIQFEFRGLPMPFDYIDVYLS